MSLTRYLTLFWCAAKWLQMKVSDVYKILILMIIPPLLPYFSLTPIFIPVFTTSLCTDLKVWAHFLLMYMIRNKPVISNFWTNTYYPDINPLLLKHYSMTYFHFSLFTLYSVLSFITLFVLSSIISCKPITIRSDLSNGLNN